jgi:microcystin-dependent protein
MDPFIGQICIFGFNFAPKGWAMCQGQLMPLSQNTALFSIVGTEYGGDGRSTFALPNLQGNAAIGAGQAEGLSEYAIGQTGGETAVVLLSAEMPSHNHAFVASTAAAAAQSPQGNLLASATRPFVHAADEPEAEIAAPGPTQVEADFYSANPGNAKIALASSAIASSGGNQPHNNMQPYLALNFCIALQGVMPPRS